MELVTHKKLKGGRLMPWGKGTVVTGAKGLVFLAGNTATTDDYEPFKNGGGAVGDAPAQWRNILTNIKSDLEELGTSLDHLIKLTFFVKGTLWWRIEFFQLPSGRDGRVLCSALPKALQLQQSSTFGANRGCCARAPRPRS